MVIPMENAPWVLRLPVGILRRIFEYYHKLNCPIQVLLQVNNQWRELAMSTQPLWRGLLLSADAMPPTLRGSSVLVCGTQTAVEQVLKRAGTTKLEITFVLGSHGPSSPTPTARSTLFRALHNTDAFSRIVLLCIITGPQLTLDCVFESFNGVFRDALPSLESMMIASVYAIGSLYKPLKVLLDVVEQSAPNLRSVHLENLSRDFIMKASSYHFWTRLARLTIQNEKGVVDASIFALSANLEFLSFSGELSYGASINFNKPVEFTNLQWLRVRVVSMGTLKNLKLPALHSLVIHTVQDNYPNPAPNRHTLELKELKILHVTSVNPSVACIVAPKLETLCLGIPTLRSSDADVVLNAIFDGHGLMIKPRHLTLTAPVHDKNLINALKFLPDLMSLQLDHQVPFSKTFFQALTPPVSLVKSRGHRMKKTTKPVLCPKLRCLVVDVHRIVTRGDLSDVWRDNPNMNAIANQESSRNEELRKNWVRELLLKIMKMREVTEYVDPLLRLACKWVANGQNEELVQATKWKRQDNNPEARRGIPNGPALSTVETHNPWTAGSTGSCSISDAMEPTEQSAVEAHLLRDNGSNKGSTKGSRETNENMKMNVDFIAGTDSRDAETPMTTHGLPTSLSEPICSLGLEQLMDRNVPVNLSGRVDVPNSFKAVHGGFSMVYHGVMDGGAVAVKVLRATSNPSRPEVWEKTLERRLRREINVWAALSHPNIVQFLGYCEGFGDFLAMLSMWCSGGTARDYLRVHNRLTVNARLVLVCDIAQGLAYLHGLKIVHGDLKPTNVLVNENGVAQLCDFGLVRLDDWQGPEGMTTTTPYTGTERYKAPELFATLQNKHPIASFEGDIYALGCIALEFVNDRIPYRSYNNLLEMRRAIENRDPPATRQRNTDSESERLFWDLLEACWSWYPENRPHVGEIVGAVAYISNLEDQHEEDYPMILL